MNKKNLLTFFLITLFLIAIYVFLSIITFDVVFSKIPGYDIYILPPYTAIKLTMYLFALSVICFLIFKISNKTK